MGSINSVSQRAIAPMGGSYGRPTPPPANQPYAGSRDAYVPSPNRPTPPPVNSDSTASDLGKVAIGLGVVAGVLGLAAILSGQDTGPGYEPYPSDPHGYRPYPNDPWNRGNQRHEPWPARPNPYDPRFDPRRDPRFDPRYDPRNGRRY